MEMVSTGVVPCYFDALVLGPDREPLLLSFFERSLQTARSFGANLILEGNFVYKHRNYSCPEKFDVFYTSIVKGKEKFVHGIAIAKSLSSSYLITTEEEQMNDLYNFLMQHYDLPLLREWMPAMQTAMIGCGYLRNSIYSPFVGNCMREIKYRDKKVPINELRIWAINMKEGQLIELVSRLLREKRIYISREEQKPLRLENMDEYFQNYGASILQNLQRQLKPVTGLNGELDRIALKRTCPYPQQAAMINGAYEYLKLKGKGFCLFSMGTGTGKTLQSAATAEMLYEGAWLEMNMGKTLADAYEKEGIVNYRHVIMCPGHLVEKWKDYLIKEIPYAKAVIINDFRQLVDLREKGRERKNGKEFYIMSKDFSKLSYQSIPTTSREGARKVNFYWCGKCQSEFHALKPVCPDCGGHASMTRGYVRNGMLCPHCSQLLWKKGTRFDAESFLDFDDTKTWPMQWYDLAIPTESNVTCSYCGESLWMPYVRNINQCFGSKEKKYAWIRQTFWSNKSKKGKKTLWILRGKESEAEALYGEVLNEIDREGGGCRKYAPAAFIKKYMKGFFDVFIADEVHEAKGGSTAQGNAFHALMKASRYTLGLTGTVAGGVATDLFYLLFRAFPGRMIEHGYTFSSELKFAMDYGCVEQDFEPTYDLKRNAMSRGRQLSRMRILPGISPKVFSDFLLDCSVFLNINDMSANMPPLKEKILLVNPETDDEKQMQKMYFAYISFMKQYERDNKVKLSSMRHQFEMSYLDKPYGVDDIINPATGEVVISPRNYSFLIQDKKMLAKEKKLVETIQDELAQNRCCVVYAEYTQSDATNIMPRLREIIMRECGLAPHEVVAMKASSPSAAKRERWMHEKAKQGMKVMICNPRLCETGLDFCWEEGGRVYNYPTLIFYQCGYSLFVVWQAAGRSWRLNQKEECHTFYIAYQGTVQQAILQVLGEKKSATAAIQGQFSADGLAAMAKGVDTQVRIAQIMSEMDEESGNHLQEMFDVVSNANEEDSYGTCKKMKLFSEIMKNVQQNTDTEVEAFDFFATFKNVFEQMTGSPAEESEDFDIFSSMIHELEIKNGAITKAPEKKRRSSKKKYDCYSLF